MLKKTLKTSSNLAFFCILVFLLSVPCLAADNGIARMTNIENARCNLVLEDGYAVASASVTGVQGANKCKIVLKIQEQQGGNWITVNTCTVEENRFIASANSSIKAKVGTTYRAQATVTVWVDGASETKTVTTE